MNHLEKKIVDLIEKIYCCKYVGKLKVTRLNTGFHLSLGLIYPNTIEISYDTESEDQFLKFIEEEIKSRLLIKNKYFKGTILENVERRVDSKNESGYCRTCSR